MAWLFEKSLALAWWLVLWASGFLGRGLLNTVGAVLALLGEEVRRYLGLALWAVVIWLAGKATMRYAPPGTKTPLVLVVLGLVVVWGLAVVRAVRFTRQNNLIRVRQRQAFRDLHAEVTGLGGRLEGIRDGLGRRAYGTPLEGMWPGNRERRDRERAEADAAAAQAEAERADVMAWEEAVAAKRAEREQFAAAAAARRRDAS